METNKKIDGHKGKIWTLKFILDGKFLATAVKIELQRYGESCYRIFYSPQLCDNKKEALVLFPHKAFHIEETPFQELYGNTRNVLDLAWSDSNVSSYFVFFSSCFRDFLIHFL